MPRWRNYRIASRIANVSERFCGRRSNRTIYRELPLQSYRHSDHHRLPPGVRLISDRLRDAGYFTAIVRRFPGEIGFSGKSKTDWNFEPEGKPFDSDKWKDLKSHQPFYAQVNSPTRIDRTPKRRGTRPMWPR